MKLQNFLQEEKYDSIKDAIAHLKRPSIQKVNKKKKIFSLKKMCKFSNKFSYFISGRNKVGR